jgi:hypothetical protein
MPVTITGIVINTDITNAIGVRYLHGNVFFKMKTNVLFEIHTFAIATVNREIEFAPTGFPSGDYIVDVNGSNFFADFVNGDNILVQGTTSNNGTYTNIIKIDDNTIRVGGGFVPELSNTAAIYLAATYTSADYFYNLVENSDQPSFDSLIDGSTQKFTKDNIVFAPASMTALGTSKAWLLGEAKIGIGIPSATFKSTGVVEHDFWITPFFTKNDDVNTPPTYFFNNNCLKYIFRLDVKRNATDVTRVQSITFDSELGATGWFNENNNTGISNYSIDNLQYKRLSDNAIIPGINLSDTIFTEVKFKIKNTVDSPFTLVTPNNFVINLINVPQEDDEYQNTTTDFKYNFSFDRVKRVLNQAAADGDFSNGIKQFSVTHLNASEVEVKFNVELPTAVYNRIGAMTDQKFLIAVYTQVVGASENSDGVSLLVDFNDYYVNLGVTGLVTEDDFKFIEHPAQDPIDGSTTLTSFTEDEIIAYSRLKVDLSTTTFPVSIKKIVGRIVAVVGMNEYVLQERELDVLNAPIVSNIEFVDLSLPVPYKAPLTERLPFFTAKRDIPADAPPVSYYDVYYPFINRWEYWVQNLAANPSLFDIAEPNNGLNEEWWRNANLYVRTSMIVSINGINQEYEFNNNFALVDYNSNAKWINENIKTYDLSNNQLISGLNEYILGFDKTKVIAEFEWDSMFGSPPSLSNVVILLRLEPFENGGQFVSTRISSKRPKSTDSQWLSVDLSDKVVVTQVGNIFKGEALIDNTLLQNFNKFAITSRIYETIPTGAKLMEDGTIKLMEDGTTKIIE